jgi:hypothetical protein
VGRKEAEEKESLIRHGGTYCNSIIPALGRLRQEDYKLKASLVCISKTCQKMEGRGEELSQTWWYMPINPATLGV